MADSRICTPLRVNLGDSEETRFWLHEPEEWPEIKEGDELYIRTGSNQIHGETFQKIRVTHVQNHGDRVVFRADLTDDGFTRSLDTGLAREV